MELYLHGTIRVMQKKVLATCSSRGHVMNKYRREYVLVGEKDWYMIYRNHCVLCGAPVLLTPSKKDVDVTGAAHEFNCKKGAAEKELPMFTNTHKEAVKKQKVKFNESKVRMVKRYGI
jgi:hypothetical protein